MGAAYWLARRYNFPIEERSSWSRVWQTFREALWAFILPIVILGGSSPASSPQPKARAGGRRRALRRRADLSRPQLRACARPASKARPDRRRHAARRLVRADQQLSDRGRTAAEARAGNHRHHQNQYTVLLLLNFAVPRAWHVPAFRRGDHSRHSDRHAAGHRGRHRPDPFRPDRDAQPRHRAADAAGGERADDACCIAKADIWETTKVNLPFIAALLVVLFCAPMSRRCRWRWCTFSTVLALEAEAARRLRQSYACAALPPLPSRRARSISRTLMTTMTLMSRSSRG